MPPAPGSPVWLGVDLGTQSARTLAVDDSGAVLASASEPITGDRYGPRHEQDAEQWWRAVVATAVQVTGSLDRSRIAGLAVDSTSGTVLLADTRAVPLTAGLMYDDGRAGAETELVNRAGAAVWAELGYQRMQPAWGLPKLVWLARHRPDLVRRPDARLLHQADLLTWRLAGEPVPTDASHALKTGYHLVDERWPTEVLDALDVPSGLLPEVRRPGSVLGVVGPDAAGTTGIPAGTPIVAGMTDSCAAQLGAGALRIGAWNSVLGTTLALKGVSERLVHDPNGVVYCHRAPDGGWLPGGASSAGAGVISRHFPGADLAALTAAAARIGPDAIAYPLVSPGERFPFLEPDARPFVLGRADTDEELFAAYLLGLACVERLGLDYLDRLGAPADGPLTFTGGATRNRYWSQLRVDLLGRPAHLPAQAEPAIGMAMLAAGSTGEPLAAIAGRMVRIAATLDPDPVASGPLLAAYVRFVDELAGRGWLPAETARPAREGASR